MKWLSTLINNKTCVSSQNLLYLYWKCFVFVLRKYHSGIQCTLIIATSHFLQLAAHMCLGEELPTGPWTTYQWSLSLRKVTLPQQQSTASSSSARGGTSGVPSLSILEFLIILILCGSPQMLWVHVCNTNVIHPIWKYQPYPRQRG